MNLTNARVEERDGRFIVFARESVVDDWYEIDCVAQKHIADEMAMMLDENEDWRVEAIRDAEAADEDDS